MKKILQTFIIFLTLFDLNSQVNLVPNPSFEEYSQCPNNGGQIFFVNNWTNPNQFSSPDYFNVCGDFQYGVPNNVAGIENAHQGFGYSGIITYVHSNANPLAFKNYREYIQIQLNNTLELNQKYYVEFHVSLSDSSLFSTNNLGVLFSPSVISKNSDTIITEIPQIRNPTSNVLNSKLAWTKISGSFVSNGLENFLIIGNFDDDNSTNVNNVSGADWWPYAYYYIDDIKVIKYDDINYIDDTKELNKMFLYPNPTSRFLTVSSNFDKIIIYNSYGYVVKEFDNVNKNSIIIDLKDQPDGMYFIKASNNEYCKFILKK